MLTAPAKQRNRPQKSERQALAAVGATAVDNFPAALGGHPGAEAVLVDLLPGAGLKSPFHRSILRLSINIRFYEICNINAGLKLCQDLRGGLAGGS